MPVRADARQRHFRDRRHGPAVMAVVVRSFSPRAGSIRAAIASDGMSAASIAFLSPLLRTARTFDTRRLFAKTVIRLFRPDPVAHRGLRVCRGFGIG